MGDSVLTDLNNVSFYFFDPKTEPHRVVFNFLFNTPDHLFLQSREGWKVFELRADNKTIVQLAFFIKSKKAQSPLRAPFGSLQTSGRITAKQLDFFLVRTIETLTKAGIKKITIVNYPGVYHVRHTHLLYKALARQNFRIYEQRSSVIEVDKNGFEAKIKISQKQKLRKSKSGFQFRNVPVTELAGVYRFIKACRHKRNQSLSMLLPELQRTIDRFPTDFFIFEVGNQGEKAAAAIVIRVNKKILYTFYYAHDDRFDKISPVVFLLSEIYLFAQRFRYTLIDLGTSMNGEEINKPLLHFKESVGGKPTPKFVFEKTIA